MMFAIELCEEAEEDGEGGDDTHPKDDVLGSAHGLFWL